jgi:hypothetical protein
MSEALEFCRECRDKDDESVPAEVIIWGKFFEPEALGPKCFDHAAQYIPAHRDAWVSYAVFDLRGLVRQVPT